MKTTPKVLRKIVSGLLERKLMKEMNPDGTISGDEDADREDLLAEVERTMHDLIQDVVTQANHIGGDFRAPGIKAECKALMLQIVRDMR